MIASCHGLQQHDRDDLEQELWLALVASWRQRNVGNEIDNPAADAQAILTRETNRLLIHNRHDVATGDDTDHDRVNDIGSTPVPNALRSQSLGSALDTAAAMTRRIDLRLDVSELLARLSIEDRLRCHELMAGVAIDIPTTFTLPSISLRPVADTLRFLFEAYGLRDYL